MLSNRVSSGKSMVLIEIRLKRANLLLFLGSIPEFNSRMGSQGLQARARVHVFHCVQRPLAFPVLPCKARNSNTPAVRMVCVVKFQ